MAGRRSTSMKDVAILAGVSVGTVSNVLNRPDAVSETTRAKVHDAINKLGWIRNETARSLRAGRSHSIGLIVMDISNPFFTDLARGVEDVMSAAGYSVLLANSAQQSVREDLHLEQLGRQRVSGVVLAPVGANIKIRILEQFGIPVVLADRAGNSPDMCTVSVDDFAGGRLAASRLLEQGHNRLAFVGGDPRIRQVHDRHDGAAREVMLAGPDASLDVIATEHLDITAGRDIAASLAKMPERSRPTGVFAANDLVAIRAPPGSDDPRDPRTRRHRHRRVRRTSVRRRRHRSAVLDPATTGRARAPRRRATPGGDRQGPGRRPSPA